MAPRAAKAATDDAPRQPPGPRAAANPTVRPIKTASQSLWKQERSSRAVAGHVSEDGGDPMAEPPPGGPRPPTNCLPTPNQVK